MKIRPIDIFYAGKLGELREMLGLKQYAAAASLGISLQDYSDLESGKKQFSLSLVKEIFKHFLGESKNVNNRDARNIFRPEVFAKLSDHENEDRVRDIINLYYKRESIVQLYKENEIELRQRWKAITGSEIGLDLPVIKIGYLDDE